LDQFIAVAGLFFDEGQQQRLQIVGAELAAARKAFAGIETAGKARTAARAATEKAATASSATAAAVGAAAMSVAGVCEGVAPKVFGAGEIAVIEAAAGVKAEGATHGETPSRSEDMS
ncbi:MAG: hypothetical protein ACREP7_01120, partial [Lysobacter sp.]